ncbi:hypothetical protein [Nisaea sp.]|uniref:hypothetical protein n=1 Tax=Nisaea sp. TaxID=2024842 RepID=UPI002B277BB7|nr:hypothetical protein [Nisaea sp.]
MKFKFLIKKNILMITGVLFLCSVGTLFAGEAPTESKAANIYNPANERPMYGGVKKTADMLAADNAFRKRVLEMGFTDEQAYAASIKLGWKYFHSGKVRTAIKRFNQAWLLMPEKSGAYHGFALVRVVQQASLSEIDQLFEMALSKKDLSAGTLSDYARFLNLSGRSRQAITQAERALAMDGNVYNARNQMAAAYLSLGERALGCEWARRARSAGESSVPEAEFQATCGD